MAVAEDRWEWIRPETENGILDTWNKTSPIRARLLNEASLTEDAERFSSLAGIQIPIPLVGEIRPFPINLPNEDNDIP